MKPEVDQVLRATLSTLAVEVAPTLADSYARANLEVIAVLLAAAAEDYERAAEVRVEENRGLRRIFARYGRAVPEPGLRARLESAAVEEERSLRVSDLNAANDRLRALLIELHTLVEGLDEEWARSANLAIWAELAASVERRAISFFPPL
jgi:hypothetical protein